MSTKIQQLKDILHYCREMDYCDVRFVHIEKNFLSYNHGEMEDSSQSVDSGVAIRVFHKGSWGFSCGQSLDKLSLQKAADEAMELAVVGASANLQAHRMVNKTPHVDYWFYPVKRPYSTSEEGSLRKLLPELSGKMNGFDSCIKESKSTFNYKHTNWLYVDSLGSELKQEWTRCGVGLRTIAVAHGDMQTRTYHTRGNYAGGLENVMPEQLYEKAGELPQEALDLTKASELVPGKRDLILGPDQLALQIHESVGHPNELDRVLGWEANFAGTSFNKREHRGNLQYGSPCVNLLVDPNLPLATGTRPYDDDGVKGERFYVVKNGIFQNYFTSLDTASSIDESFSRGCSRADNWNVPPIVRIPNVMLLPGEWELPDLLRDTDGGLFLDTNSSWSIDQRRDQFQFGVEMAWEIKNGEKQKLYKNCVYRGHTLDFWNAADAICNARYFDMVGEIYCGKGQPMQTMEMAMDVLRRAFDKLMYALGRRKDVLE